MRSRFLPVLSIFAGGLVYATLPHGAFGAYDIAKPRRNHRSRCRRDLSTAYDVD